MPDEICLDTSVVVDLFRSDIGIRDRLNEYETIWLPSPVRAEILCGAHQSKAGCKYDSDIAAMFQITHSIPCDDAVAETYARIKNLLRVSGTMIPINDIWIASCAMTHNLRLATRDAHFNRVPGLMVENW